MPIRPLSPELQQLARDELNEDPDKIEDYLQQIREWIATQDNLNVRPDDQWLLNFLRGCKYNLDKAKRKLDSFYTIKTLVPELFGDRDPLLPKNQELLELGLCIPLPKSLNWNRSPVFLLHYKDVNTETIHIMDIIKIIIMSLEIVSNENDNVLICGIVTIEDLEDLSLKHMLQVTPSNAKKIFTCFQDAYPVRPKRAHFINAPGFFKYLYALIKTFMNKKLKERIRLCNLDEVHKEIPRSVLPIEYGGEDRTIKDMAVEWKKKVESYREWFLDDVNYCSDESKRPGNPEKWSLWSKLFGD